MCGKCYSSWSQHLCLLSQFWHYAPQRKIMMQDVVFQKLLGLSDLKTELHDPAPSCSINNHVITTIL